MNRQLLAKTAAVIGGITSPAYSDIILETRPSHTQVMPGQPFHLDLYISNEGEPGSISSAEWSYTPSTGFDATSTILPPTNDFFGGLEMLTNQLTLLGGNRVVDIGINQGPSNSSGYLARLMGTAGQTPGQYTLGLHDVLIRDGQGVSQEYTFTPISWEVIPSPGTATLGIAGLYALRRRRKE